jgi:hypothetical protein
LLDAQTIAFLPLRPKSMCRLLPSGALNKRRAEQRSAFRQRAMNRSYSH